MKYIFALIGMVLLIIGAVTILSGQNTLALPDTLIPAKQATLNPAPTTTKAAAIVPDQSFQTGIIADCSPMLSSQSADIVGCWQGFVNGVATVVYSGAEGADFDPQQGVVYVLTMPSYPAETTVSTILTPVRAGAVQIVAAQGNMLTLESETGSYVLNFSVDTAKFTYTGPATDISGGITNPLFSGDSGSCPKGWICSGSPSPGFASYTPTAAQYPGGSPFQTSVYSPTVFAGSGVIRQLTSLTWTGGTSYLLDLWTGLPNMEPDGKTQVAGWPQAPDGTVRLYLTMGPGFGQVAAFDIPAPHQGGFTLDPIVFTLPVNSAAVNQKIGLMIYVSSTSYFSSNFAITPVGQ